MTTTKREAHATHRGRRAAVLWVTVLWAAVLWSALLWNMAGLLLSIPSAWSQTRPAPPDAQADPYPVWPTDGCGFWENQGILLFFREGGAEPLGQTRFHALLDHIAAGWKADPGTVLIEGHLGLLESPPQPANQSVDQAIDLRRAEAVRDGLTARGVPVLRIWTRTAGTARPLLPGAATEEDDQQNRRAVVVNTSRGNACLAERRQLRVTWFRAHCTPAYPSTDATLLAGCARALDEIARGE